MILLLSLVACESAEDSASGTTDVQVDNPGDSQKVAAAAPRACIGSGNREFVVWQDNRSGKNAIYLNYTTDGKGFLTADVQINTGEGAATNPSIACAAEKVYVVWEDDRDGDYNYKNIYLNYSSDSGATWLEEDLILDADPEGDFISLAPQVVAKGTAAYVAWYDNQNGAYDIFLQSTTNGGKNWMSAPVRVDTDSEGAAYSAYPVIAADTDGNVVIVWEDSRDGKNDIYANASSDFGQSFQDSDTRLDGGEAAGGSDSFSPSVAMAGEQVYVTWHDERNGDARDIYLNSSSNRGKDWASDAIRVESDAEGLSDSANPIVLADGGSAYVIWQDDRSGGYDIYLRRTDDGGASWTGEEQRCDTDEPGIAQSYEPTAVLADGTLVVAWRDGRYDDAGAGVNDLIYNYSTDGGATWQGQDIRINSTEPGLTYAEDLTLALVNGNVYSVWADGRYGQTDIFFANRALGESSVYVAPDTGG